MNAINDPDNKLNMYISLALEGINGLVNDPFLMVINFLFGLVVGINLNFKKIKFRPTQVLQVRKFRNSIRRLREFAKQKIEERIAEMESDDFVADDILSIIFKTASKNLLDLVLGLKQKL